MKIKRGSTSVRRLVFIADTSSTTGAGLANLVYNSSGLVAYYFAGDLNNGVRQLGNCNAWNLCIRWIRRSR